MDSESFIIDENKLTKQDTNQVSSDPARSTKRFIFLALSCLLCIGSYYAYDNPAALETQLEDVSPR